MLDPQMTLMFAEAHDAAAVLRRQYSRNADRIAALATRLRGQPPRVVVTLARGSSDNAATFARYLIETRLGILTSSASPSIASVYDAAPDMTGTMLLAISQSGRSPDLIAAATAAKERGAFVVSLVNDEHSPLFALADVAIPLDAGAEKSVAATKSFIATLGAILQILAEWSADASMRATVQALPDLLDRAWAADWSPALSILHQADHLYVAGRGHGLGVAQEMALKFKETCGIHAEAFSAAEIRHGPMALVGPQFPVMLIAQDDQTQDSVRTLAGAFTQRGAPVLVAGLGGGPGTALPTLDADPLIQPILMTQSFYRMVNNLSVQRGHDPDRPPALAKVTETV
jgi:glucosamine--fructose-6-phosphate aminotransferase (isomerizing)